MASEAAALKEKTAIADKLKRWVDAAGSVDALATTLRNMANLTTMLSKHQMDCDDFYKLAVEDIIPMLADTVGGIAAFRFMVAEWEKLHELFEPDWTTETVRNEILRLRGIASEDDALKEEVEGDGGLRENAASLGLIAASACKHMEKLEVEMGRDAAASAEFKELLDNDAMPLVNYVKAVLTKEKNLRRMCNNYDDMLKQSRMDGKLCMKALRDMEQFYRKYCMDLVEKYARGLISAIDTAQGIA
jgi:hypothetical protein